MHPGLGLADQLRLDIVAVALVAEQLGQPLAKSANGALRLGSRACGSATPLPTPVEPSSSRLAISRTTSSAAKPVAAAASVESCSRRRTLSLALTSIMT